MAAKILTRLVKQLKAKGFSEGSARAIAVSSLQKSGDLKKGSTTPTAKGKKRGDLSPAARAKDRASKYGTGHKPSEYNYNKRTNRATLKKS